MFSAGAYLAKQLEMAAGQRFPQPAGRAIDHWAPASVQIAWLAALRRVGQLAGNQSWETAALRACKRLERTTDLRCWTLPTHIWAHVVEGLIDLDRARLAEAAMRLPAALQRRDGGVPALPEAEWVSGEGLAQLAKIWLRLGRFEARERANRALTALANRRRDDGALPGSWGQGARYFAHEAHPGTVIQFLDAMSRLVGAAFDSGDCEFPAEIHGDDGRWQAVLCWAKSLGPRPRIADAGCGQGRFLRRLRQALPDARLTGVDIAGDALAALPEDVRALQAGLLRIPAGADEFDGVLCVEALEHALAPRRAVAELCRIVRPGGGVLIIDKDIARQPLSEHQSWERWFAAEEVRNWLAEFCDGVTVDAIAHGAGRTASGLFLCWRGVRRNRRRLAA